MVLSSIFFEKGLVTLHLILAVFFLLPLVLKFQILVQKFQRQIRVSSVAQRPSWSRSRVNEEGKE